MTRGSSCRGAGEARVATPRGAACRRAAATALAALAALACAGPWVAAAQRATGPSTGPSAAALTVEDAVALAQRQGLGSAIADAQRDAARQRDRAFNARLLPQVSLGGTLPDYNRAIIPVLQPDGSTVFAAQQQMQSGLNLALSQRLPFTGGELFVSSALSRLDVTRVGEASRAWSSTPYAVGIRQDLLRPNALRFDQREQALRADAAEQAWLEAREDVALEASNAFFALYVASTSLTNAQGNAAVNDTLFTLNKARFAVGKIGENDLLQSELALLRARNAVAAARLAEARARAALRLTLNIGPAAPLEIAVSSALPEVRADTQRAVQEALRRRASLLAAQADEVSARRRIADTRWGNGLQASLGASFGVNAFGSAAEQVYRDLREQQRVSLAVSVPLFQWGARGADLQAANADLVRIDAGTRALRERVAQEAHFAVLQLDLARSQVALAAKADTVAQKRFEVAYNRYVIGRIDVDNLFLAQSEKDLALQAFVQALRDFWDAYYRLRRATLWDWVSGGPVR